MKLASQSLALDSLRSRNTVTGRFRQIRDDALIGNVKSLARTPDVVATLGGDTSVAELRAIFGGRSVSEIATMPKLERATLLSRHFERMGVDNHAAQGAVNGTLLQEPGSKLGGERIGFDALFAHLETCGRLADLYSAKADMSEEEKLAMWNEGISVDALNAHLEAGLEPKSEAELAAYFGAEEIAGLKSWLSASGRREQIAELESGRMSRGEAQNLIYGSWESENTPYDASYGAKFEPLELSSTEASWVAVADRALPLDEESARQVGARYGDRLGLDAAQRNDATAVKVALGKLAGSDPAAFKALHDEVAFGNSGIAVG